MSNYDSGFARAQQQYEAQLPPGSDCDDEGDPDQRPCPDCDGGVKLLVGGAVCVNQCGWYELDGD